MPDFFHVLEIFGLVSFAISGAGAGMAKKYDAFGVLVISFVTAIGGGTLRDLLLGNLPVNWMRETSVVYIILISSLLSMCLQKIVQYLRHTLFLFDAVGLSIFTIAGIEHSVHFNTDPVIAVLLGTITGSFGGVIRDILCQEKPIIFRQEIYATASIVGGALFFLLKYFSFHEDYIYVLTMLTIFFIRIWAVYYQLRLPSIYKSK